MDITHKAKYIRHGLGKHPINAIWKTIKDRCYNPKSRDYKYYGAIGIKMRKFICGSERRVRDDKL